jgi:acetylornithine deacetylase/succinyl-diaminopimelate desuccinylase-like protein
VPAAARLYVDRRLTAGETPEAALAEIRALPGIGDSTVELLEYDETSWTGERARQDKIFPAWVLPEEHVLVRSLSEVVASVTGAPPRISRWGFSTNGVATMGRHGIPSVGFAPGLEELAHTTEEWVAVEDLVTATAAYSLMPEALAVHADELSGG